LEVGKKHLTQTCLMEILMRYWDWRISRPWYIWIEPCPHIGIHNLESSASKILVVIS
jgi:hypothetical protein